MSFSSAVEAHLAWTVQFRQSLRNRQLPSAEEVEQAHCCPLGTWLQEVAQSHYGHLPAYPHCLRDHAAFHREAAAVVRAARQHGHAHAEQLLAAQSPYTEASGRLMLSLHHLRHQAQAQAQRPAGPVRTAGTLPPR